MGWMWNETLIAELALKITTTFMVKVRLSLQQTHLSVLASTLEIG